MPALTASRAKRSIDNGPPVNAYVNPGIIMFKRTGSVSLIRIGNARLLFSHDSHFNGNEFCLRISTLRTIFLTLIENLKICFLDFLTRLFEF